MNEYVYLLELDSVNTGVKEMQAADQIMNEVIVDDGDILVLTYNQFADSKLLGQWIQNTQMKDMLIELLDKGRIVVSPFGGIRSCVEYIMNNALKKSILNYYNTDPKEEEFIFSALPFISGKNYIAVYQRTEIYEKMWTALVNSDISYLDDLDSAIFPKALIEEDIPKLKQYIDFLLQINLKIKKYLPMQVCKYPLFECIDELRVVEQSSLGSPVDNFLQDCIAEKCSNRSRLLKKLKETNMTDNDKEEIEEVLNFCYCWQIQRNIHESGVALKNFIYNDSAVLRKRFEQFKEFYKNNEHEYYYKK